MECDEVHGDDNVAADSDDFTVETALEDLEFGFSVIQSTQKVSFSQLQEETFYRDQSILYIPLTTSKKFE